MRLIPPLVILCLATLVVGSAFAGELNIGPPPKGLQPLPVDPSTAATPSDTTPGVPADTPRAAPRMVFSVPAAGTRTASATPFCQGGKLVGGFCVLN